MTDRQAYQKDQYEKNKEKRLAYAAEYRTEHREEAKAYAERWRNDPANKETIARYRATRAAKRKASPGKRTAQEKEYRKKAIREGTSIQGWLIQRYGDRPCTDCGGVFDFVAMDFDHRPEETKEFGIGKLGQYVATPERIAKVKKEIAKCDLVCSNCHRVRTKKRNG